MQATNPIDADAPERPSAPVEQSDNNGNSMWHLPVHVGMKVQAWHGGATQEGVIVGISSELCHVKGDEAGYVFACPWSEVSFNAEALDKPVRVVPDVGDTAPGEPAGDDDPAAEFAACLDGLRRIATADRMLTVIRCEFNYPASDDNDFAPAFRNLRQCVLEAFYEAVYTEQAQDARADGGDSLPTLAKPVTDNEADDQNEQADENVAASQNAIDEIGRVRRFERAWRELNQICKAAGKDERLREGLDGLCEISSALTEQLEAALTADLDADDEPAEGGA